MLRESLRLPLDGEVMDGVAALSEMKGIVSTLRGADICVVSAYLKVAALHELLGHVDSSNRVRILVRWQLSDLLMGSSDTDSFSYAGKKNWGFYARQDLHAKIYSLGPAAIYIGSANLTSSGFSLAGQGNAEMMVRVPVSSNNVAQVESLLTNAVQITDIIAAEIRAWIDEQPPQQINQPATEWPFSLARALNPHSRVDRLMTSECFATDGTTIFGAGSEAICADREADLSLLALGRAASRELVLKSFLRTRIFRWLVQMLEERPDNQMYFGEATELLHAALLDDPRPYRKNVKLLLANLLSWIELCKPCGVIVDRPKHSQRIRLAP